MIDNIASDGPEEAELEHERERFRRMIKAPADALDWFATGDLIGVSREKLLEQITWAPTSVARTWPPSSEAARRQ